jgi:hypothetical protein
MAKQATVRLPEDLAEAAEAVAIVKGTSVSALIIESLSAEVARVRADKEFTTRANRLLTRQGPAERARPLTRFIQVTLVQLDWLP